MASDILLHNAHKVPVGKDQEQHLELSRNIALRFNNLFGEFFPLPEPVFTPVSKIMSLAEPDKKMSKSLGDKRHEISKDQIREITDLYLGNKENGRVKIFGSTDFAFRKVQVDRPLRLNFQASEERIKRLLEQTAFANLCKSSKKKPPFSPGQ